MTSQNPDNVYDGDWAAWQEIFTGAMKNVHTAMPAQVISFDMATRRAIVQPSLDLVLVDGTAHAKPPIVNVPVVSPCGGGIIWLQELLPDDQVLLIVCERGIDLWKQQLQRTLPDETAWFQLKDAMVIAGIGPTDVTPAAIRGGMLQTYDGSTNIQLADGRIELNVGGHVLSLTSAGLFYDGNEVVTR